jgi:hypothetical protein
MDACLELIQELLILDVERGNEKEYKDMDEILMEVKRILQKE